MKESNGEEEETILIVDDDDSIRQALELSLQLEGHRVVLARDGLEALEWLRGHDPPCMILLDLMMPRMDGWELLSQLRCDKRLARVPIIVITAFQDDLGNAAALPILRKPIELDSLLRVTGEVCPESGQQDVGHHGAQLSG